MPSEITGTGYFCERSIGLLDGAAVTTPNWEYKGGSFFKFAIVINREVKIFSETLLLLPQKAAFWQKKNVLFLADLHLGKINHFRKAGIPVPAKANDKNLELLIDLLRFTKPDRVICLGDLFHSHYNPEWEVFGEVVKHFRNISFELVLGNHDIMSDIQYSRKGIRVHDTLRLDPFILTHHPMSKNTRKKASRRIS